MDDLLELFIKLVEIPSPSGHERAVADFILGYLRELGYEPYEDASAASTGAGCGNVRVRVAGRGQGTPLLIAAHIDTVPVAGPVRAVVEDGVVRSAGETILGADDKGAVAILLRLLAELKDNPPGCAVEAVFTTSEEVGLRGAKAYDVSDSPARAGFVFDSSGAPGTIITSAPTQRTLTARFHGVAAHAGIAPEAGRSAIVAASKAVAAMPLGRIDEQTTANIGVIEGGEATNVVPEWCELRGEARSRDEARLAAQLGRMLDACTLGASDVGVDVTTSVVEEYRAFALPADALPVRLASAAVRRIGKEPQLAATGGGSDVNVFNEKGLPSVNLSLGMERVHTHDEFIRVAHLHEAYDLVRALVDVASATTE